MHHVGANADLVQAVGDDRRIEAVEPAEQRRAPRIVHGLIVQRAPSVPTAAVGVKAVFPTLDTAGSVGETTGYLKDQDSSGKGYRMARHPAPASQTPFARRATGFV